MKLKVFHKKEIPENLQIIKNKKNFQKLVGEYLSTPQKIPKIIHQVWLGPKMPPYSMDSWRTDYCKKYPEWKYMLWTENSIKNNIKVINDKIYKSIQLFDGKSDVVRYEILYQLGGIYIDSDCHWTGTHSLDKVFGTI